MTINDSVFQLKDTVDQNGDDKSSHKRGFTFQEKFADAVKDVMKEWRTIRIISQILHILKFPSTNNLFFINFPEDDPINFGCMCTP